MQQIFQSYPTTSEVNPKNKKNPRKVYWAEDTTKNLSLVRLSMSCLISCLQDLTILAFLLVAASAYRGSLWSASKHRERQCLTSGVCRISYVTLWELLWYKDVQEYRVNGILWPSSLSQHRTPNFWAKISTESQYKERGRNTQAQILKHTLKPKQRTESKSSAENCSDQIVTGATQVYTAKILCLRNYSPRKGKSTWRNQFFQNLHCSALEDLQPIHLIDTSHLFATLYIHLKVHALLK